MMHNYEGNRHEIMSNISKNWTEYLTEKLEEQDLRYLLQKDNFARLIGITFTGMSWLDNLEETIHPAYTMQIGLNAHNFRDVWGKWGKEVSISTAVGRTFVHEYEEPSEQEILMELFEEFKMDEVLTNLRNLFIQNPKHQRVKS